MTKEVLYTYLGTNGTITSPVHLEDVYYIRKYRLIADTDKVLKKQGELQTYQSVIIPEDDLDQWIEI